jgi:enoyl-CoA hydratase/carnithine racemase
MAVVPAVGAARPRGSGRAPAVALRAAQQPAAGTQIEVLVIDASTGDGGIDPGLGALSQLRRAASLDIADCLRMERTMVRRCFEHGEVIEGVRALAIDKDHSPTWNPSGLQDVTSEMIAGFFESAWPDYAHPLRHLD